MLVLSFLLSPSGSKSLDNIVQQLHSPIDIFIVLSILNRLDLNLSLPSELRQFLSILILGPSIEFPEAQQEGLTGRHDRGHNLIDARLFGVGVDCAFYVLDHGVPEGGSFWGFFTL